MTPMFAIAAAAATLALGSPGAPPAVSSFPGAFAPVPSATSAALAGFGASVAVGDGEVFVGEAQTLFRPGTVFIFRKGNAGWSQAATLQAPDAAVADGFGSTLAFDGTTLYVGAGAAKLHTFRKNGGTWQHVSTIEASAAGADARFGAAVSGSGDWLLVSRAPAQARGPAAPASDGAVFAFRRAANGGYSYHSTIAKDDTAAASNGFGMAIGMSGNTALIGASGERSRAGLVHEFVFRGTEGWVFTRSFAPNGVTAGDQFGVRLAVRGNFAVVTASGDAGGYGAVYTFRKSPTGARPGAPAPAAGSADSTWYEVSRLTSPSAGRGEGYGIAVAVDEDEVWVGAPGVGGVGGAFVYPRSGNMTVPGTSSFLAPEGSSGAFGVAVGVRGSLAALGGSQVNSGAGGVLIYEKDASGTWQRQPMQTVALDELVAMTGNETECAEGRVGPFECSNSSLLSFLPPSSLTHDGHYIQMNDVWGWTDAQTGKEWAVVGRRDGTTFIDMSDPLNPVPVADLPMTPGSTPQSWRDMKTYRDHAYIVADNSGAHGMQVFDMKRLRSLRPVNGRPVEVRPDTTYRGLNSAHNIVINEESGFAYAVGVSGGGNTCGGGLHMIDIRNPGDPQFVGCFSATGTGRTGTGYSHDAQCVMYKGPDTRYTGREICIGSNETAISIADVTDKQNPKAVSSASYPNVAYAHQGWFTDDHKYFYLDDEIDELQYAEAVPRTRTLVWDLTDLENPRLAKEHLGEATSSDHNLYVLGNQMFQANYMSGLRILNIEDRENPREVSYFDTDPYRATTPGYSGAWSVYPYFKSGAIVVNSIEQGFFILKQSPAPRTVF